MIYVIGCDATGTMKIGYTGGDVLDRMSSLQTSNPFDLHVITQCVGSADDERLVHSAMREFRIGREWFWMYDRSIDALDALGMFDINGSPIDFEQADRVAAAIEKPRAAMELEYLSTRRTKRPRSHPPEWTHILNERQAANYLGWPEDRLARVRVSGRAAPHVEHGGDIVYRAIDIASWSAQLEAERLNQLDEQIARRKLREARANRAWVRRTALAEEAEGKP